ncbi:hypothetical protein FD754_020732, partial [Muntiacus muntjak]
DVKSEVPVGLEPISPLDLRTDLRMMMPVVDPVVREKQLQQELLLIQQQQQIQKQLLIAEFQKQHENLTRQHQAQLQEHIKELLAIKQQQELLEKEQKLEQQRQEQEVERHRREQQLPPLRGKDRGRETSEPNLKVRSRLKQKVAERRSSPLLRRKDGNVVTSFKKRMFEVTESSVSSSSPGSGPSSPNNGPTGNITENETSVLPPTPHAEKMVSQQRILIHEDSMNLLSLYTSPSLPNITLGLPAVSTQLNASNSFKEKQKCETQTLRQGVPLPGQYGGSIPASSSHPHVTLEGKPNSSHQALLQHLLLKEQMRQQKLLLLSKSIEQLKQPGSHLEEAEEELQGDQAMQEDRAPSSGSSARRDSSACVDDTLGQAGAVKVKEEPVDSDEDAQIQEMESGEQAAFMQQVIGKDLAPGFVIKVII